MVLIFKALRIIRKAVQKLFSRLFVVALGIVLQLAWLFLVLYQFSAQHTFANVIVTAIGMLTAFYVISRPFHPAAKLAWTVVLLTVPLLGILIYFVFGRPELTKRTREGMEKVNLGVEIHLKQDAQVRKHIKETDANILRQSEYILRQAKFPVYEHTETKYYPCGEEMFEDMLDAIGQATQFIFLEYFIIEEGLMWGKILEILARKAKLGVEVRVMYDGMCEFSTLSHDYPERLRALGIACKMFAPVIPFASTHYNYRDHRKILVIDGHTAFNGGVNLADEYINQVERFGHWKDTAVMLEGGAVKSFTLMFLQMWNIDEQTPEFRQYLCSAPSAKDERGYVIPYGDCPLDGDKVGERVYMDILNRADRYVHIMTPYLILDGELETALKYAAERGVDVKIILPGIPDKKAPYALAKTHYASLLKSGVGIYEYIPGFVHAKVFVSDDNKAVVGTINLDYRSLYHHFECATFLYETGCIPEIERDFTDTLARCRQVTAETIRNEKLRTRIFGSLLKVIAPLL